MTATIPPTIWHRGRIVRPEDIITLRDRDRHQVKCTVHKDLSVEIGSKKIPLRDFALHGLSTVELQRSTDKVAYEVGSEVLVKNTKPDQSAHPDCKRFNAVVDEEFRITTPWGTSWPASAPDDPFSVSASIVATRPVYRYGDSTDYFRVELTDTGRVEITIHGTPMLDAHSTLQMGRDIADLSVRAAQVE